MGVAGQDKLQRGFVTGSDILIHMGNTQALEALDLAAIRRQFAAQHREQAGFTAAVGADKSDALPGQERGCRFFQQQLVRPAQRYVA